MKQLCMSLIAFFCATGISAQTTRTEISQLGVFNSDDQNQAKIYFTQDNQLKEIILGKAHTTKEIHVWRVQIYQGSGKDSRAIAISTRNSFKTKYPEIDAEPIYHSPYFKVQVGNFKSRLEAESFRKKIVGDYQNCWVIKENIKIN